MARLSWLYLVGNLVTTWTRIFIEAWAAIFITGKNFALAMALLKVFFPSLEIKLIKDRL
jgi:hypothetical protein